MYIIIIRTITPNYFLLNLSRPEIPCLSGWQQKQAYRRRLNQFKETMIQEWLIVDSVVATVCKLQTLFLLISLWLVSILCLRQMNQMEWNRLVYGDLPDYTAIIRPPLLRALHLLEIYSPKKPRNVLKSHDSTGIQEIYNQPLILRIGEKQIKYFLQNNHCAFVSRVIIHRWNIFTTPKCSNANAKYCTMLI